MKRFLRFFLRLFLINFLINLSASAAIPTPEGLFRNGGNKSLKGNFAVLKLRLQELPSERREKILRASVPQDSDFETFLEQKYPIKYLKFIFSLEEKKKIQLLQITYLNKKMSNHSISHIKYIQDLEKNIDDDKNIERKLFYALFMMFSLNKSFGMANVVANTSGDFSPNKYLMNQEKKMLLEKYKKNLLRDKKVAEGRKTITDILKGQMYPASSNVSLVREQKKFYWKVSFENFSALFKQETHRLEKIDLTVKEKHFSGIFADYILFDGLHQLPKMNFFKTFDNLTYQARVLSFREFTNKGKRLSERAFEYRKKARPNGKKMAAFKHFSDKFLY